MRFYHIDRTCSLNEEDTINLIKYIDINSTDGDKSNTLLLQNKVDEMFPDGVSKHGEQYYISSSLFNDTNCDIELIFELVRRYKYPDKLSRFESFFAVDKENIPIMLNQLRCNSNNVKIFEVECEEYSKHDMKLLNKGGNLVNTVFADLYWEGKTLGCPTYEYLLKPPVKIIREIKLKF